MDRLPSLQIDGARSLGEGNSAFEPSPPRHPVAVARPERYTPRSTPPESVTISFGPFSLIPGERRLLKDNVPVRIGGRALDLLIALVENPGQLRSKRELLAKVWPHAVVEDDNLKVQVAALRRVLGDGGAEYISSVAGRGYCFVAPVMRQVRGGPAVERQASSAKMAIDFKPLVRPTGMDIFVSEIAAQLKYHRLITLVGPGGVGKSCIAAAVASTLSREFPDSVRFIELNSTREVEGLSRAIATAHADSAKLGLLDRCSCHANRKILFVLDGCEGVIGETAQSIVRLLQATSNLRFLVTSREPLNIAGERLKHVRPLAVPDERFVSSIDDAMDWPAVQLFVNRATEALGEFQLRDCDLPLVLDICRKTDGLPLALELAAAHIWALGLEGVASSLDHPMDLPAVRRRTSPPHHSTLRASMDWSYRLLKEEEKRALCQLSLIDGSFTTASAIEALAGDGYDEVVLLENIVGLVAKSLLVAERGCNNRRLKMLTITRAYARLMAADYQDNPR